MATSTSPQSNGAGDRPERYARGTGRLDHGRENRRAPLAFQSQRRQRQDLTARPLRKDGEPRRTEPRDVVLALLLEPRSQRRRRGRLRANLNRFVFGHCQHERMPTDPFAERGQTLVVQRHRQHDEAQELAVFIVNRHLARQHELARANARPKLAATSAGLERAADAGMRIAPVLAAHEVRPVAAQDDAARVDEGHERDDEVERLPRHCAQAIGLLGRGLATRLRQTRTKDRARRPDVERTLEPSFGPDRIELQFGRCTLRSAGCLVPRTLHAGPLCVVRDSKQSERAKANNHDHERVDRDNLRTHRPSRNERSRSDDRPHLTPATPRTLHRPGLRWQRPFFDDAQRQPPPFAVPSGGMNRSCSAMPSP